MLPKSAANQASSSSSLNSEAAPDPEVEEDIPRNSSSSDLFRMFARLSQTSDDVNRVWTDSATDSFFRTSSTFESLQMLTQGPQFHEQPPVQRKRARPRPYMNLDHSAGLGHNDPKTPSDQSSRWDRDKLKLLPGLNISPIQLPPLKQYTFVSVSETEEMTDEELLRMKGPSRLIGFLVDIAMKERARKALRWTGNGLEFILVNKELVAKMWGNRKHNTKDMDYYKLSRAIREKYDKKDKNSVTTNGKLKKGSRTYSYVFTENSYTDLMSHTGRDIKAILNEATRIGNKYHGTSDIHCNSPQALSPQNSDEGTI